MGYDNITVLMTQRLVTVMHLMVPFVANFDFVIIPVMVLFGQFTFKLQVTRITEKQWSQSCLICPEKKTKLK